MIADNLKVKFLFILGPFIIIILIIIINCIILLTVNMCVLIAMVILMHMSYRIPLRLVNDDYSLASY